MSRATDAVRLIDDRLLPGMERLSNWPLLVAVRSGLAVTIPLVLLGSLAVLLNSFPLPAYKVFMEETFGPNWRMFGEVLWTSTFAVMSLTMQFSVGSHLASHHNARNPRNVVNPLIAGLVSFSALLSLIAMGGQGLDTRWMGVSGLFVAIVVAVASVRLFLFLYSIRRLRLHIPGGTPDFAVPEMFTTLLPGMLTVLVFAGLGMTLNAVFGTTIHEAVNSLLRLPFDVMGDTVRRGLFYISSVQGLWFVGVHGSNVLDPITHHIYGAAMEANAAAAAQGLPLPHVMTKTFMDVFVFMGGAGTSISLGLALILFADTKNQRRLAGISLAPGIFNLNEILLFGLPVILNPVMLIPFMLTPVLLGVVSYVAVAGGFVPGTSANVEWTTPVFLNAYLSTGSMKGALLQVVNLAIGVALYAPFVRIGNRINTRRVERAYAALGARLAAPGADSVGIFEQATEEGMLARTLLSDLEDAFHNNQGLFIEFQPQVSSATGRVTGVETMLRWRHPYHGMIPESTTVALAEGSGLIRPLGLWVFDQACAIRKEWQKAGVEELVLAVNVSAVQLDDAFSEAAIGILRRHGLMPDLVELEIAESTMLGSGTPQSAVLSHLHALGLRIAIDDFGMGHNSLKYLKQFPVSTIKIDGMISREVVTNPICADIVSSITRLCRARRMNCVAEYVESESQAAVLRTLGVDALQGLLFSRYLSPDECLAYIQETNARASIMGGPVRSW